ncbi:MAG: hypothetical protein ACJ8F7_14970 [Gemmataceae bacterium]
MSPTDARRLLALLLRCYGVLDSLAVLAVLAPRGGLSAAAQWLGVGPLPPGPLTPYLARTASALFVLHGVTVLFISFDVERYNRLIRFLACAALVHGAAVLAVDLAEGMPWWWCATEGPGIAFTGALVLLVRRWARRI